MMAEPQTQGVKEKNYVDLLSEATSLRTQLATLTRERDEAVAREAVMREALDEADELYSAVAEVLRRCWRLWRRRG